MAAKGPKPKRTSDKRRAGNPGKRRLNTAEPQGQPVLGLAPEWMPAAAKDIWAELLPVIAAQQPVEDRDITWFSQLCVTAALYRSAVTLIDQGMHDPQGNLQEDAFTTTTDTSIKTHPNLIALNTLGKELRLLLNEGGLTPTARSRIMTPRKDKKAPSSWSPQVVDGGKK